MSVRYGARPMSFGNWTTFTFAKSANKRLRDYTATQMKTEPESARANAFVAFLADTLLPELRATLSRTKCRVRRERAVVVVG